MNTIPMKTENGNVSCETPEGSVVHINITQRSAFDCLLDTFRFFQDVKKSGQKTENPRVSGSTTHLGFGAAYISLGLLSVILAIIIAIVQPYWIIYYSGLHFWVGIPFLVSGILNLVTYKYPRVFWMALAFMSLLVNFGVSIAGIVIIADDVQRLHWRSPPKDVCSDARYGGRNYYETTRAPRYDDDFYLNICKSDLQRYQILMNSLIIITLLMLIWGLCLVILDVACRVKSCCCSCTLEPEAMNTIPVKTENNNVSYETPEGSVVHINITQRSAFDCLLDTFRFFREMKKSGQKTESPRVSGSTAHLGFGVTYISLGLVSVMLAIPIAIAQPYLSMFFSYLHFWIGFPFLVSGILNLVTYKYPKTFWMPLALMSLLVNFGVSFAGMFYTVGDVQYINWRSFPEDLCSNIRYGNRNHDEPTRAPRYDNGYDYDLERCITEFRRYKLLECGLVIMTLLMLIWGLCLAMFAVGYRLWSCCRSCKLERTEEEDDTLIKSKPSDDIITV